MTALDTSIILFFYLDSINQLIFVTQTCFLWGKNCIFNQEYQLILHVENFVCCDVR
jgi:hypothetical protein